MSVDYYHINLQQAITTLTPQNEVDFCAAGQEQYCSLVSLNNGIVYIQIFPLNLNKLVVSGVDVELDSKTNTFGNPFSARLLANHTIDNYSVTPTGGRLITADSAVAPNWKAQLQFNYEVGGWSLFANERFISAVKMDPNQVEGVYTDNNHVPAVFYTDITLSRDVTVGGAKTQLFVSVENLFNRNPPVDVVPPIQVSSPTNAVYDRIGRYITGGIKFKF